MLNEKRVKLMAQMAMYETKEGHEDLKISAYYQKDYASLNTWITAIWSTVGYLIVVGAMAVIYPDEILQDLSMIALITKAGAVVIGYIVTVLISAIVAHEFYRRKHVEARKRMKQFNHDLIYLGKMYEKEIK